MRRIDSIFKVIACLLLATAGGAWADDQAIQYGRVDITRDLGELIDRQALDADTLENLSDVLDDVSEVNWKVYVPESYDPSNPAGLFVYISPVPKGYMPRFWHTVLEEENLIWVSADNSGNKVPTKLRMLYAVLAPAVVAEQYRIDQRRVYLSGFSGGGKVASMVSVHFPHLFRGAMFIGGAEFWRGDLPPQFEDVKNNRYVFVTGSKDFNLELTRRTYKRFKRAGVENIKLTVVRNMGHSTPEPEVFGETIAYLDNDE